MLTASTGADSKLRALQLGATDFLSKPVDPSELALRVRNTHERFAGDAQGAAVVLGGSERTTRVARLGTDQFAMVLGTDECGRRRRRAWAGNAHAARRAARRRATAGPGPAARGRARAVRPMQSRTAACRSCRDRAAEPSTCSTAVSTKRWLGAISSVAWSPFSASRCRKAGNCARASTRPRSTGWPVPLRAGSELGLIGELGQWVLEQACLEAASWKQAGPGELKIAINVAKPQFVGGELVGSLRRAMFDSALPPGQLVVELTESMLMDDVQAGLATMNELKDLGVTLSIDDFGTGYSSLSYLKAFPLDELKIDRSFVMDLPGRDADVAIVQTVIGLGHSLGMSVIAEGVETPAQLDTLRRLGCDQYQGFLHSKPAPPEQFREMLARQADGDATAAT